MGTSYITALIILNFEPYNFTKSVNTCRCKQNGKQVASLEFEPWFKKRANPVSSVGSVCFGKREVMGSIPGRDMPKLLKMVLAAPCLELRRTG